MDSPTNTMPPAASWAPFRRGLTALNIAARLANWGQSRNYVALGNLGEQITGRLLVSLGYQLLGAQDDFLRMVSEVLGIPTKANPEDFIAVDPDGRLVTVNSKASISPRACRITRSGDLSKPRLGRGQNLVDYSTLRANLGLSRSTATSVCAGRQG